MRSSPFLLFDLGGVVLKIRTFERLNQLLPEPVDSATLKSRWLASSAVRRFELGETSPGEFAAAFVAEWGIRLTPQAFVEEFTSWVTGFYPQAREALRALRQRHRTGCLSNCNVLHWEQFNGFKEDFDIAISSHRLGAIKPDEEAFVRALGACGAEPANVLFFDDSAENVHTASRLGIRAFHVEGFAQAMSVLRAQGVLAS